MHCFREMVSAVNARQVSWEMPEQVFRVTSHRTKNTGKLLIRKERMSIRLRFHPNYIKFGTIVI